MKKHYFLGSLLGLLILGNHAIAQNIAINEAGILPDTSAMLDVSSTKKGFLLPRMTTTQRNAIPLPANGLTVYNTTTGNFDVNKGTPAVPQWTSLSYTGSSSGGGWSLTGNSGTTANNYIGTSDGQSLYFKINGTTAGMLGLSGSSFATSFGVSSTANFKSTAIGASATASQNNEAVALGYNAKAAGYRSVAIGADAEAAATNETIAIGFDTHANSYQGIAIGSGAATSSNNQSMAIGVNANATGYQSTAIGVGSKATRQNSTAIGNGASATSDNYIAIGNTSVTAIRGQVNFNTFSDGRFKRNIQTDVPGLDFILQLRPVTYNWDIHKFNAHHQGNGVNALQAAFNPQEEAAIRKKESITYTGFIAQEVAAAAAKCNYNFSGVLPPADDKDAYSLSYAEFVVPLVKATQELSEENHRLSTKLEEQQQLIQQLVAEIKEMKKALQ